ncbi:MAG: hypothetical protein ACK55Z_05615, partial [bacterium]
VIRISDPGTHRFEGLFGIPRVDDKYFARNTRTVIQRFTIRIHVPLLNFRSEPKNPICKTCLQNRDFRPFFLALHGYPGAYRECKLWYASKEGVVKWTIGHGEGQEEGQEE